MIMVVMITMRMMMSKGAAMTMVAISVISNQKFCHYYSFDTHKCCSIKTDDGDDGDDDRIDERSLANLVGCICFCPRL